MPKLHQIDELFNSMNNYEKIFIIKSENGQIVKKHNWKEPYPKMYFKENKIEKKILKIRLLLVFVIKIK